MGTYLFGRPLDMTKEIYFTTRKNKGSSIPKFTSDVPRIDIKHAIERAKELNEKGEILEYGHVKFVQVDCDTCNDTGFVGGNIGGEVCPHCETGMEIIDLFSLNISFRKD